jgi:predicted transcriptional regulator
MTSDENPLEHKTRRSIFNYITNHPGVSSKQVQDIFGLNKSTFRYHIACLERSGKVRCEPFGSSGMCFYSTERPLANFDLNIDMDSLPLVQRRLINLIKQRPGITKPEMMAYLDIDKGGLNIDIKRLEDQRIIARVRNNGSGITGYEFLSEERLAEMIYKRLLLHLLDKDISEGQFLAAKRKLDQVRWKKE